MSKTKQCGSVMRKGTKVDRSIALQLLGVLVFFLGLAIAFGDNPRGIIVGLILMV